MTEKKRVNNGMNNGMTDKQQQQIEPSPSRVRRLQARIQIRRLVTEGHSHEEIMYRLGIPERTYFRWLAETYQQDHDLLESKNEEELVHQLIVLKDRLNDAYLTYKTMAVNANISTSDRIHAQDQACVAAISIARLQRESPAALRQELPKDYLKTMPLQNKAAQVHPQANQFQHEDID